MSNIKLSNYSNLEQLIDHEGLNVVLNELATICYEKAIHIRENWRDKNFAKVWDKNGSILSNAAIRVKP
jgi:hypothetical protein